MDAPTNTAKKDQITSIQKRTMYGKLLLASIVGIKLEYYKKIENVKQ